MMERYIGRAKCRNEVETGNEWPGFPFQSWFGTNGCRIINGDARELIKSVGSESVDCIITSPPYMRAKDYGTKHQMGFGQQSLQSYFNDMFNILSEALRVTKFGGAFWLIVDNVKDPEAKAPLPNTCINLALEAGWVFEDSITWDKGKGLPWSHRGRLRNVSESILLFSKGGLKTFNLNAVRVQEDLSPYWVKYPERFHPEGKAPSDIWHIPIPTQGTWGKSSIRHFCPFPGELVTRCIRLTTIKGEQVLDPFAGTGAVPAVAEALDRKGAGFEINRSFCASFHEDWLYKIRGSISSKTCRSDESFSHTIKVLRCLKLPRTLFTMLSRSDLFERSIADSIVFFVVNNFSTDVRADELSHVAKCVLHVGVNEHARIDDALRVFDQMRLTPPASKFGVDFALNVDHERNIKPFEPGNVVYAYRAGKFYSANKSLHIESGHMPDLQGIRRTSKYPLILSDIHVDVESFD